MLCSAAIYFCKYPSRYVTWLIPTVGLQELEEFVEKELQSGRMPDEIEFSCSDEDDDEDVDYSDVTSEYEDDLDAVAQTTRQHAGKTWVKVLWCVHIKTCFIFY